MSEHINVLNQYIIALTVTGVINLSLCLFVISRNLKKRINQVFALYSLSLALWSIFEAWGISTTNSSLALLLWRINHIGVIFIPIFLTHFTFLFLNIQDRRTKFIPISYVIGFIFLILNTTPLLILNVTPKFSFRYFINPGYLYYPFLALWIGWAAYGNVELLKEYFRVQGYRKQQMKYFCWALLLSYIGGVPNFLPTFNIEIPWLMPFGTYTIPFYAAVAAYSIIRYRLFDIRLTITKLSIFFAVYALVLGIPFFLSYKYQMPNEALWLMLILATAGPYIYTFLRKQAENKLLQNQKAYQHTLKQAAYGIGKIKKLDTLLRLVRRTATKSVGISQCSIYLIEDKNETTDPAFNLTHSHDSLPSRIKIPTSIVDTIKSYTEPFIIEEVLYSKGHKDEERNMAQFLKTLRPEVVIPIVQSDNLLALILLGKKANNSLYTNDDLTVFSILGNQAGVAIENCLFIEAEKDRLKREGVNARRESLDMMVSTMAHEIDNPITSVVTNADILKEEIEDMDKSNIPEFNLNLILKSIKYVIDDSFRVSRIIEAVREYSKGSDGDLNPMLICDVLDDYRTLFTLIKKDFYGVDYVEEIEENIPLIYAEPILIEEVLVNFSKNAFQAVRHNKGDKKVTLRIYKKNEDHIRIEVQDNGSGIPPKILKQLYEVPTTTKGSAEGTGIGLYRIRQICKILKARYGAESEGEDKGALMYVEIPIYKGKFERPYVS